MPRGFTLIETLISLLVMSVLLAGAAPSFERMIQQYRMKRLAAELQGFFSQARLEAVMRHRDLWIHYAQQGSSQRGWVLVLRDDDMPVTYTTAADHSIMLSRGEEAQIQINWETVKLDGVSGKPDRPGNIRFSLQEAADKPLKLVFHHITGRVRICGGYYGYPACL